MTFVLCIFRLFLEDYFVCEPDSGVNAPVCSAEKRALAQTGKHIKVRLIHGVWCVTAPLISVCECVNLAEMSGMVLHLLGHSSHLSFRARKKKKTSNGHSGFDFNRVQVSVKRAREGWMDGRLGKHKTVIVMISSSM